MKKYVSLMVALAAFVFVVPSYSASTSTLKHREHRQVNTLHRYQGTLRFFHNHARLAKTATGKREVRKAHVWIKIIKKELAETRAALHPKPTFKTSGMVTVGASWYGPGLYGNGMACGGTLSTSTMGVANKTMPCGTMVTICYNSKCARVPVVDRGPYVGGREFDLTGALAVYLGYSGASPVQYCRC